MKSFLVSSILLAVGATQAFACDQNAPYGLKGVNVGEPASDEQLAALLTTTTGASACLKDPESICHYGDGTIGEQPVQLMVVVRDGKVQQIFGIFDPANYNAVMMAVSIKYCMSDSRTYSAQTWRNRAGSDISVDQRVYGTAGAGVRSSISIESQEQRRHLQGLADQAAKDI